MSDEPKGTFISLTEFAEDCGKTPLNILRKSIRLQTSAFVRLKGQGTLTIFDEIDGQAIANFMKMDMKNQLWELPYSELEKLMIDMPPWHITSVVPPDIVKEDPKHYQFQFQGESINEDDLFLVVPATNKTENNKTAETKHLAKKNIRKRFNKELHRIFWRAFTSLRVESGYDPKSKEVWNIIHDEVRAEQLLKDDGKIAPKRTYDPHEHIERIDPTHAPYPQLHWLVAGTGDHAGKQGSYGYGSLPALLYKLKKTPPKV